MFEQHSYTEDYNNPYKFNGKELQEELGLNMYDYGARNYDPALGRWMNVDPLAEKAPDWTPYRAFFNNPLRYTDPTGMYENEDWYVNNESGDIEWFAGSEEKDGYMNIGDTRTGTITSGNDVSLFELKNDGSFVLNNVSYELGESVSSGSININSHSNTELFFNGLANTCFGLIGAIASGSYVIGTDGAGAALGGGTAFTLSIGEMSLGLTQMADSFNKQPTPVLHEYSTMPGFLAERNNNSYAPYIDGVSGFIPGVMSGSSTLKSFQELANPDNYKTISKGASTLLGTYDASSDAKGLYDGTVKTI